MKKLLLFCLFSLVIFQARAQDPTLTMGLQQLTLNKGQIDVAVLTEIIMEKQKELKQEALKRFMFKMFPETNYATKFYVQNCLNILLNEKNPKVIEREILEHTTNYALAIGVAKAYQEHDKVKMVERLYNQNKEFSPLYRAALLDEYKDRKSDTAHSSLKGNLTTTLDKIMKITKEVAADPGSAQNRSKFRKLDSLEKVRVRLSNRIERISIKDRDAFDTSDSIKNNLPFGVLLDVTFDALSQVTELRSRGFFKRPFDFREDKLYTTFNQNTLTKPLADSLNSLRNFIKNDITPYVLHYDVIKEFFATVTTKTTGEAIKNTLFTQYTNQIFSIQNDSILLGKLEAINNLIPNEQGQADNLKRILYQVAELKTDQNLIQGHKTALANVRQQYRFHLEDIKNLEARFNKIRTDTTLKIKGFTTDKTDSISLVLDTIAKGYVNSFRVLNEAIDKEIKAIDDLKYIPGLLNLPAGVDMHSLANLERIGGLIDSIYKKKGAAMTSSLLDLIRSGDLLKSYLTDMTRNFSSLDSFALTGTAIDEHNREQFKNYYSLISEAYSKLSQFTKAQSVSLKDIRYIEETVIPSLINSGIAFSKDAKVFKGALLDFRILAPLLKINAIMQVNSLSQYQTTIMDLLAFISNLDNLDQAQTYQSVLNLLDEANKSVENNLEEGNFKEMYLLFTNGIRKYTIINTEEQYLSFDVASALTELQAFFNRNDKSVFGLYLTLGLNQNLFFNPVNLEEGGEPINNIGFASEKLGVKFKIYNFNRLRGYENVIKNDVSLNKRAPFINQLYATVYGSGLLYSIANTTTNSNFDYPHIGTSLGLRFYNSLDLNLNVGFPFIKNQSALKNGFIGLGLDIPLGEYLERAGKKNKE